MAVVERNCVNKRPNDPLFPVVDPRKTLAWINAQAGTKVQGHGLRATFASIAEELVSGGVLKRMMNHAAGGDLTLGHYIGKSEAQLLAGWQTVADFVEAAPADDGLRVQASAPPPPAHGNAPSRDQAGAIAFQNRVVEAAVLLDFAG